MLKRLAILCLALCMGGAWSQVPRDGSQQQQPTQSKHAKSQPVTQPCICTVKVENAPAKQAAKPEQKSSNYPWRELYAPANIPNWLLVGAGIFGGWLALRTLRAIRRQVDLQTLTLQQWVYLTNWEVKKLKNDQLRIKVHLVNQSGFPLTLREGELLVEDVGASVKYLIGEDTFLPPNTPMQIEIDVTPTQGQLPEFDKGSLSCRVTGGFSYIDRISGRTIVQPVNGSLACGWWGAIFHGRLHMNPVESEPPKEANSQERPN